ncbi:MAG TPA: septation protein A [Rhizomicrobium sp.]|nr:septation protein A [Rhizomicrobium sp.]
MTRRRLPPLARAALDIGPLVLFFAVLAMTNVFIATGAFMAVTVVTLATGYAYERRLSPMAAVTALIVLVFGGLTLWLHNDVFIKVKPTILYLIFAAILSGGLVTGRNLLKYVFDQAFHLDARGWRLLTWRWACFFVVMAIANEIVWRNFSIKVWAGYKLFGAIPITFLFAMAQAPLILRHHIEEKSSETTL